MTEAVDGLAVEGINGDLSQLFAAFAMSVGDNDARDEKAAVTGVAHESGQGLFGNATRGYQHHRAAVLFVFA